MSKRCAILFSACILCIIPACDNPSLPNAPGQVEAPAFSPPGGSYDTSQSVAISTATPEAAIRYTTDGSEPTSSSGTLYGGPVAISATTTILAIAYKEGMSDSSVASVTFTIAYTPAAAPALDPPGGTYSSDQGVTIGCSTPGATIYYTTDGSDPSTSGARLSGPSPLGPISVAGDGTRITIRARAISASTSFSSAASEEYRIVYPAAAAPSFNPPGGTYSASQGVTIESSTPSATIWYTMDGSDPAASGTRLSGPSPVGPIAAAVSPATTIRAIATAPSFAPSPEAGAAYKDYYSIGDPGPAGGWVFYDKGSYSNGWRYLEAAPTFQSADMEWWNGAYSYIGTTDAAIGSGAANTAAIVASQGNGNYAARICGELSAGGYDDWFLPSKDELNEIFVNLYQRGVGGFIGAEYWSSSEDSEYNEYGAWYHRFSDGTQNLGYKDRNIYVRAARDF